MRAKRERLQAGPATSEPSARTQTALPLSSAPRRAALSPPAAELLTAPYPLLADLATDGAITPDPDKLLPPAGDYRVSIDGKREGVLHIAPQGIRLEADPAIGGRHLLRFI